MQALAALGSGVRLLPATGTTETLPTSVRVATPRPGSHEVIVSFGAARTSAGLVTENRLDSTVRIASVVVTASSGSSYDLDGPLSADLTPPHWVPDGTVGPFAAFSNNRAAGMFRLAGGTGDRRDLKVRVLSASPWTATETVAITSSAPATVVRSVADIPGWNATSDQHGRPETIALHRDGLVQSFAVPRGTTLVTFTYSPPGLAAGLVASGSGLAVMLLLGLTAVAFTRRRLGPADPGAAAGSVDPG